MDYDNFVKQKMNGNYYLPFKSQI